LVAQGSLTGAGSGEEVVPATDYRALQNQNASFIGRSARRPPRPRLSRPGIHQKSSNARNSDAHRLSFERAVFSN
jgi:hypothetical protein